MLTKLRGVEMVKYFKVTLVMVLTLFSILSFSSVTNAKEHTKKENEKSVAISTLPEEASFDLSKPEKQEVTYVNENGEEITFGIEPIQEESTTELNEQNQLNVKPLANLLCVDNCTSTLPLGTSTWKIYSYSGAVNMSYRIEVYRTSSSSSIRRAYDLSVTLIGYSESNRYFGFTSKQAEYSATVTLAKYLPVSLTVWLKAEVSGSTLTTRVKS